MARSIPDTTSRTQSQPEDSHSQSHISRIIRGVRQHLRDTKAQTKRRPAPKPHIGIVGEVETEPNLPLGTSKGLSVYSYICAPSYSVEFSVPGHSTITNTSDDNLTVKDLEIDTRNIPPLDGFTGRFQWKVLKAGTEKSSGYNDINAVTGNVEGGTMLSEQNCIPIITEDAIITWLFYDAGHGEAGLPSKSQCTVTVTPTANRTWMEDLAVPGSKEAQKPFSRLVLAAPHDAGMNSMECCNACLHTVQTENTSEWLRQLPNLTTFKNFSPSDLLRLLPDIVCALCITQTASIKNMLMMGARYFEFRPAKLYPLFKSTSGLRDTDYFTHLNLPGLAFDKFLDEIVQFLDENQQEIVVIHIRWDGVLKDCSRPTTVDIFNYLQAACSHASKPLTWTDKSGLSQPIDLLRNTDKRIILLINCTQYSSYDDAAYATLTPTSIINAFNAMTSQQQQTADITLLQCQATATNIKQVVAYSVLASNASNSPLTATKAVCDLETLPWCSHNVLNRLGAEKPVIIMDDFFDGSVADTAISLSQQRLAAL